MKKNIIISEPSICVVFGVTGDLSSKKILPALWHLFIHNKLPDKFFIIGSSRSDLSQQDFRSHIHSSILKKEKDNLDRFDDFFSLFKYQAGEYGNLETFENIKKLIDECETRWGICTNKLFYLSTPPQTYKEIFTHLADVGLNTACGGELGWSRILIEKPFGTSKETALELQGLVEAFFKEEQVYRIDHYLFKEIIQGIENFRFSNNLFENSWDNTMIASIDVRLFEDIDVSTRGAFYDQVGALRDVGQNHLISMLSLLIMKYPNTATVESIRQCRTNIINELTPWTKENLISNTHRSQYDGYLDTKNVKTDSTTETHFMLKTSTEDPRFRGVPITLEAGKSMGRSLKEIVVTLKHADKCLLCAIGRHEPNKIVFTLDNNDEVKIHFSARKPGYETDIENRSFSFFLYEKENKQQYVEEYAKVLHAAIQGKQEQFISKEEVLASWNFIDPVREAWDNGLVPLETYNYQKKEEIKKEIVIIGLGKMGAQLARRLNQKSWKVYGYNKSYDQTKYLANEGVVTPLESVEDLAKISSPKVIWVMVPHTAVDDVLRDIVPYINPEDIVIDAGNSYFKDTVRRANELADRGINFVDVGFSGGPEGALKGACLMFGGSKEMFERYEYVLRDMAIENGYKYIGNSGSGHFVKMVHNGIEYGMMQAIAEGFHVIKNSQYSLNVLEIAQLYNTGSVVESHLVGWLAEAYKHFGPELTGELCCSDIVQHSGEGEWTVKTAQELGISVDVIKSAFDFRVHSQESPSYAGRVVSAMRHEFGGHDTRIIK